MNEDILRKILNRMHGVWILKILTTIAISDEVCLCFEADRDHFFYFNKKRIFFQKII